MPPESESLCGHVRYATCFAYNTRHVVGQKNPYMLRHGRPTKAKAVPFGALLDFRPPEPILKKMPMMVPRGIPGLMLGYHMLTGGRWSGDYLVSPLSDWEEKGQDVSDQRRKIRIFRVKEIVFDPDPEKITFPLREAMDKKTRGIDVWC